MRDARRGLTLVEALVAMVLAAALLTGFLAVTGSSLQLQARAEGHARAQGLARALLAAPELRDGSGRDGALRWRIALAPAPGGASVISGDGYRLVRVSLRIDGPGLGRGYGLVTERVMQ